MSKLNNSMIFLTASAAFFIIYSLIVGLWPTYNLTGFENIQHYLQFAAAKEAAAWLAIGVVAYLMRYRQAIFKMAIGSILAGHIAYMYLTGHSILFGDSFDSAVMAVYLCTSPGWVEALIFLPFIIVTKGASAAVVLASGTMTALSRHRKWVLLGGLIGAFILSIILYPKFFNSNGRLIIWAGYLDLWIAKGNILFGFGPGSFNWLGPIHKFEQFNPMYMHNDFVQSLFETGTVGFILLVGMMLEMFLLSLKQRPVHSAAVVGFAACMMFYSPMQIFIGKLLFAQIVLMVYFNNANPSEQRNYHINA